MVDLFRYIEFDFAVPVATDAIDVTNESDFQTALGNAAQGGQEAEGRGAAEFVRALAEEFLTTHFKSPTDDPTSFGQPLDALARALGELPTVTAAAVDRVVHDTFGKTAQQVVSDADFTADRELLQNSALAVKLITGFDRVDAPRLVRQLRAAAVLQFIAAGAGGELTRHAVDRLLDRPLRIPAALLAVIAPKPLPRERVPHRDDAGSERIIALRRERDRLQASYNALLAVRPQGLELATTADVRVERPSEPQPVHDGKQVRVSSIVPGPPPALRLGPAARESFLSEHSDAIDPLRIDLAEAPVEAVVEAVGRRLRKINQELLPLEVPTAAKVFRVGGHLFAETLITLPTGPRR